MFVTILNPKDKMNVKKRKKGHFWRKQIKHLFYGNIFKLELFRVYTENDGENGGKKKESSVRKGKKTRQKFIILKRTERTKVEATGIWKRKEQEKERGKLWWSDEKETKFSIVVRED
jgi:hypothetical protein